MSLERETLVRLDSENPRYLCCGKKVEILAIRIALFELVFSLLALIIVMSVTAAKAPMALASVSVTLVIYVVLKISVSLCIIYGVLRDKNGFLVAYLVFKGMEISAAAIGILISFLMLVGLTTFFGVLSSTLAGSSAATPTPAAPPDAQPNQQFPADDFGTSIYDDDFNEAAVTASNDYHFHVDPNKQSASLGGIHVTGILAAIFVALCIVIGTGVYFFMVVLKSYHMLQDRAYHEYNLTGAGGGGGYGGGINGGIHPIKPSESLDGPWPDTANVLAVGKSYFMPGPRFERL